MAENLPPPVKEVASYAGKPLPEVDPADLRAVYDEYVKRLGKKGGSVALGDSVYRKLCSDEADLVAVWYRTTLIFFAVNLLAKPVPDAARKVAPADDAPSEPPFRVPDALRQDLTQSPLPEYVFKVVARFPIMGIGQGGTGGAPWDVHALVLALLRAAASASPLP